MTGKGYCDAHIHVVADLRQHEMVQDRAYTPGIATLEEICQLARPHGIDRLVVVQPSFYGTDNSVLLKALDSLKGNGRGVVVLEPAAATPALTRRLNARGIRGVRINLYGTTEGDSVRSLSDRFKGLVTLSHAIRWHIEIIAALSEVARIAALLAKAPVPIVIDHYGLPGGIAPGGAMEHTFLELLHLPHVWVKLSAPYRSYGGPVTIHPDERWLKTLLQVAPDRCVWGSDWPWTPAHPNQEFAKNVLPYRKLDYAEMLDTFRTALPSSTYFEQIMRINPAKLYEFGS